MAVAVALLMIGGEFDLSAGAMTGLTGLVVGILTTEYGVNIWAAILVSLGLALAIGFVNGVMLVRTGLPSFIVTLGTFFVLQGIDLAVVEVRSARWRSRHARRECYDRRRGLRPVLHLRRRYIYVSVFWWVVVVAVATWVLLRTRSQLDLRGRWRAAGSRQVGVPVAGPRSGCS